MFYLSYFFSKDNNACQHEMWDLVIKNLKWNGQGKALEIGTGAGGLAIKLAKKYPESLISGIDSWGKFWDYSRQQCEKNAMIEDVADQITFEKASASNLPYNDGEFDAIVSNFVYHEVRDSKDKRALIKESLRVLKKGGVFSLQDTFKNEKRYGDLESFLKQIKQWGVDQLNFIETVKEVSIPAIFRPEFKKIGVLCGIK
jgi:ubiquinone/menaquinone biosynthesis C-methylase UbiE